MTTRKRSSPGGYTYKSTSQIVIPPSAGSSITTKKGELKGQVREQLNVHIATFLTSGGKIQDIPIGLSGRTPTNLTALQHAFARSADTRGKS